MQVYFPSEESFLPPIFGVSGILIHYIAIESYTFKPDLGSSQFFPLNSPPSQVTHKHIANLDLSTKLWACESWSKRYCVNQRSLDVPLLNAMVTILPLKVASSVSRKYQDRGRTDLILVCRGYSIFKYVIMIKTTVIPHLPGSLLPEDQ